MRICKQQIARDYCKVLILILVLTSGAWAQFTLGYTFDPLNRLIEVHYPDKVIRFTYDDAGNRTGMTVETLAVAPSIITLSPAGALVGGSGLTLRINGYNFTASSIAQWNGENRATTFISANEVRISLSAADVAATGTASVVVINPSPGPAVSNPQTFSIVPIGSLTGRVMSGGNGLSNVTVNLTGSKTESTVTDANGNYSFAVFTNGSYTLTPSFAGYTFTPGSLPVSFTGAAQSNLDFSAAPVTNVSVSGRVVAADGRGITNALVTLTDQNNVQRHISTGRNGNFQFDNVTTGQDYTISVTQRRFMFTPQTFSLSGPLTDVNFIGAR